MARPLGRSTIIFVTFYIQLQPFSIAQVKSVPFVLILPAFEASGHITSASISLSKYSYLPGGRECAGSICSLRKEANSPLMRDSPNASFVNHTSKMTIVNNHSEVKLLVVVTLPPTASPTRSISRNTTCRRRARCF